MHLEEPDSREKRLTEADMIICVLEDVTERAESKLDLSECADDLENNICLLGLPEEADDP